MHIVKAPASPGQRPGGPTTFLFALLLCALPACGGGGGGGEPTPPIQIEIGTQSATVPSTVTRSFLNPTNSAAVVTAVPGVGPFSFGAANLGAQVPAFGNVSLEIVFTPEGSGAATGIATLRWDTGGGAVDQQFEFSATGEAFNWEVTPDPVDFGDVLPGDEHVIDIRVRNGSQRSPVTFSGATLPPAGSFSFMGVPFPQTIQPGQWGTFRLKFAPTAIANQGGILRLGVGDVGGPIDVPLWANSTGSGDRVVDFGSQTLDAGGNTPELEVDVPADAVSVTFEGHMTAADTIGLGSLVGPGGKVYSTGAQNGPMPFLPVQETFSVHIPNADQTSLVSGGGIYKFRLRRTAGFGGSMDVRVIIERRSGGTNNNATLPLNIFLANGIAPTQATATADTKLQAAITRMDTILQARGIRLGDIAYYDVLDANFDHIAQGEERQLFPLSSAATKTRLNLFFVRTVWAGQLVGLSAAIDGPKRKGESGTGVVVQWDGLSGDALGTIACHECCHYLGLWHTVEANGVFDLIADTPQCPIFGTNANCSIEGGGLLMHWQALGGTILSAGQGRVLRGHALLHPPGQTNQKPRPLVVKPMPAKAAQELLDLPPGWCGCCRK